MSEQQRKRHRTKFTEQQLYVLETFYQQATWFNKSDYIVLGQETGLPEQVVKGWLNNRRRKDIVLGVRQSKRQWKVSETKPTSDDCLESKIEEVLSVNSPEAIEYNSNVEAISSPIEIKCNFDPFTQNLKLDWNVTVDSQSLVESQPNLEEELDAVLLDEAINSLFGQIESRRKSSTKSEYLTDTTHDISNNVENPAKARLEETSESTVEFVQDKFDAPYDTGATIFDEANVAKQTTNQELYNSVNFLKRDDIKDIDGVPVNHSEAAVDHTEVDADSDERETPKSTAAKSRRVLPSDYLRRKAMLNATIARLLEDGINIYDLLPFDHSDVFDDILSISFDDAEAEPIDYRLRIMNVLLDALLFLQLYLIDEEEVFTGCTDEEAIEREIDDTLCDLFTRLNAGDGPSEDEASGCSNASGETSSSELGEYGSLEDASSVKLFSKPDTNDEQCPPGEDSNRQLTTEESSDNVVPVKDANSSSVLVDLGTSVCSVLGPSFEDTKDDLSDPKKWLDELLIEGESTSRSSECFEANNQESLLISSLKENQASQNVQSLECINDSSFVVHRSQYYETGSYSIAPATNEMHMPNISESHGHFAYGRHTLPETTGVLENSSNMANCYNFSHRQNYWNQQEMINNVYPHAFASSDLQAPINRHMWSTSGQIYNSAISYNGSQGYHQVSGSPTFGYYDNATTVVGHISPAHEYSSSYYGQQQNQPYEFYYHGTQNRGISDQYIQCGNNNYFNQAPSAVNYPDINYYQNFGRFY